MLWLLKESIYGAQSYAVHNYLQLRHESNNIPQLRNTFMDMLCFPEISSSLNRRRLPAFWTGNLADADQGMKRPDHIALFSPTFELRKFI